MTDAHLDRRGLFLAGAGVATTAALLTFEPAAAGERQRTKTFKGELTDPDGPDWVYLPFRVPKGVRAISVKYRYEPTPLGPTTLNVVDIGIFDPSGRGIGSEAGFRGWSGGSRDSFRISRSSATPGYLPGPITPGRWNIVLGPYQISGDGTPYRVDVTLHFGRRGEKFEPTPAPTAVRGTGAGWYRGDLHVHTVHSDGSQTPKQVIGYARKAGLDFIGTSEHNTTSAHGVWGRVTPDDFLVIAGEEVTTRAGHWLAAGLPSGTWIDWRYRPENGRLRRFTEQVRKAGGLSIAAHPFQIGTGNGWQFGDDFTVMDAIEVWNGPWSGLNAIANAKAVARWHELLTAGVFKPAVGNSDTHKVEQRIGLAQTVVRAARLSKAAIIAGYRGGHSWITGSSEVDLEFAATLGAARAECGDRLASTAADQVAVRLHVTGVPVGSVATLIGPGATTYGAPVVAGADGAVLVERSVPGGTAFVRAEVRQGDAMVAMTNPIFLG
ncbi:MULTISPECIES: CehA/McbA family metallohydrolase [unclassified Nocardioides]|uniref:CehA/McbA family metallohydrolase n=1 Tax=unclassified Nocardioides TaxID=2615069 RepID=UPI003612F759